MRTLRQWYEASRRRGAFFVEIEQLSIEDVVDAVQHELAQPAEQNPWTLADLRKLKRTKRPLSGSDSESVDDREQQLQWRFMDRRHLSHEDEIIVEREIPSSPKGLRRRAVLDLLAFDRRRRLPIIVELKQGAAHDSLTGVVFELLVHWAFYRRNFAALRHMIAEAGHDVCEDAYQPALAVVAPEEYFVQTKRRSPDSRRRHEVAVASKVIRGVEQHFGVELRFLAIPDDWFIRETTFAIRDWSID